jgi:hypothetical protein
MQLTAGRLCACSGATSGRDPPVWQRPVEPPEAVTAEVGEAEPV